MIDTYQTGDAHLSKASAFILNVCVLPLLFSIYVFLFRIRFAIKILILILSFAGSILTDKELLFTNY